MTKNIAMMLLTGIFLLLAGNSWGGSDDILGTWSNEDGKAKIEIYPCDTHFCGKISWLGRPEYPADDPGGMAGQPRVDRKNPDQALRNRRLLGLQIMDGFTFAGDNSWEKGRIYDPESGKTYQSKITLVSPHKLKIRGFVGIPLFGRSTTWSR
jgi:uncharacterized protein (DUF2147 family)